MGRKKKEKYSMGDLNIAQLLRELGKLKKDSKIDSKSIEPKSDDIEIQKLLDAMKED